MKVKEIDRTANIAWSPASHHPIYLLAGTAAQQLDATFSTTAALEIYSLNLTEPGLDMALKGSVVSDFRFHKVAWSCHGMQSGDLSGGVIVGGADAGNLLFYDPVKLLEDGDALLYHKTKHSGPVHALDFNSFQTNLLASGASDSEIFIWDLNNPNTPMTPGAKSQPAEEVTWVAWNLQVQHILASTFPARCVVWDLRKNEPIIKVSDATARIRCKMVAWHPEVATQLCLASEDDHCPVIQLWDLRFATSPLKILDRHQRGVLSIAWCPQDPDLLLSCGKDNRILCWNPNSTIQGGEVVCELPTSNQWSFDVAWCPRNPAVIASSSFDGHISVYALMGGQQQAQCSSKIAEAFPGADTFTQPPLPQTAQRPVSISLKRPPKWLRKPVGGAFGFGGKLVSFVHQPLSAPANQPGQQSGMVHTVFISQVVTEPDLLSRASKLESALNSGSLTEFCMNKMESYSDKHQKMAWSFLQATFDSFPRRKMLSLLGYDPQAVSMQVSTLMKSEKKSDDQIHEDTELIEKVASLNAGSGEKSFQDTISTKDEIAEEKPLMIKTDKEEKDGLLSQALLTGYVEAAVELCLKDNRWADALVLAQAGGQALLQNTQKRYFKAVATDSAKLISAVVTSEWAQVVNSCHLDCWKEALAAILTYAKPEEFAALCESLGSRLECERNGSLIKNAMLCYICAGSLERLAQCWVKMQATANTTASLQGLVEQVMILRQAVEQLAGQAPALQTGTLSALLGQYAALLASQGSLSSAITYLVDVGEQSLAILRDRLYQCLGIQSPNVPFPRVTVRGTVTYPSHQVTASQPLKQLQQPPPVAQQGVPVSNYSTSAVHQGSVMPSLLPTANHSIPPPPPPQAFEQSSVPTQGKGHLMSQKYPRHLHDPSVYSEPSYSQYYQNSNLVTSQPQMTYNQTYSQPQVFYSTDQSTHPTYTAPNVPHSSFSSNAYNAPSNSNTPGPMPPCLPLTGYLEVKPGWNDPPLLKHGGSKPAVSSFDNPAPITTPIIGESVPEPASVPGPPSSAYFTPNFTPQIPNVPVSQPSHLLLPQQPAQVAPEPTKERGPIPPEHQILQDILEDLRQQCQQVATNPQTRRKLDDIARKLENLYDKLREKELSSGIVLGLHQIIQAIQQGDYPRTLAVHSQLVSSANFSETSSFMPGIKVLLQTAQQLGVYLQ